VVHWNIIPSLTWQLPEDVMKNFLIMLQILCLSSLLFAADGIHKNTQPARDNLAFLGHSEVNPFHLMDVEISGDRAYVLDGFNIGLETYDISDPTNPTRIDRQGVRAWGAKAYGDRLYVFCRDEGFRIYDIGGSTPSYLGNHNPSGSEILFENGVLDGNDFYVAAHQNGLYFFNVANPGNPYLYDTASLAENSCWDVEIANSHLFVANGRFGLSVVDISAAPTEVAVLPLPGLANHILLDGDVAVLSLGGGGLATVDISTPSNPVLLDRAHTDGCAFGSGIWNHKVAVGSWKVLELFDVTDPANISRIAVENTKTWAMGADIKGWGNDALLAVADWRGMSTYQTAPDSEPDIDVSPDSLDFGEVDTSATEMVIVRNGGNTPLDVTVGNVPAALDVHPLAFTLGPGAARRVRMQADGAGSVNGKLNFYTNDPDEATFGQYVYLNNTSFPQVGSEAPDFVLEDPDGFWHHLSDYRGRVIFLEFGGLW